MKVGILTFHCVHNYGAMIQAYALQEQLRLMGVESCIIDYRPDYLTNYYHRQISFKSCFKHALKDTIKLLLTKLLASKQMAQRYDNFQWFCRSYMKLIEYPSKSGFSDLDYVILGSDQIWFDNITGSISGPYYGDGFKCKVLSYAASSRYDSLNDNQREDFRHVLTNLKAIGVREQRFSKLLQPLTSQHVFVNLDPTLLASKEIFDSLNLRRPLDEKYVYTYEVATNPEVKKMAENFAKANGCKLISMTGHVNLHTIGRSFDLVASPKRMLEYIKYAECVFTTSFHGTALSLVFEKNFYSIRQNNSADDRMYSLLSQLDIVEKFINMYERPITCHVDYERVNPKLKQLKQDSFNYLNSNLIN